MATRLKLPGLWNYFKASSKTYLGIGMIIVSLSVLTVNVEADTFGQTCTPGSENCTDIGQTCNSSTQECACSDGYIEDSGNCTKDHEQECNATANECHSDLQCLPGIGNSGNSYCLCAQGPSQSFWDSGNDSCRTVEDLKVQTVQDTTMATSVTLTWSINDTYGLSVKYYLDWSSEARENVTSPKELHGLTPGQVYSYNLVTFLSPDTYYSERTTSAYNGTVITKKGDTQECSVTNECRNGLECLAGTGNQGKSYCLCAQGTAQKFWDSENNICRSVEDLKIQTEEVTTTATSVTLRWSLISTYGLSVKYYLDWSSGRREEVTSPKELHGLTPGQVYSSHLVPFLRGNEYYSERMTSGSGHLVTFTTKKGDTQECSVTNECRNGLECLAGTGNQGKSYCLCAQGTAQKFWDSENNICRSVEDLKIQTEEVTTTATSVTLRWSLISTYGLSVKYYLDWSSGRREEVTSPKELHGLTPGQVYSSHLVPFLRGNEYYSERMTSGSGHLVTFTTKKGDTQECSVTNECRNGLECLAGTGNQGKSYCLCAQGTAQKFWDSENNICRSVEDLKIQTEEVTTTATSVTLRWSLISTYGLSVKYYLDWSSGSREEVTSPKELHGLTPGQVYSSHLVPFLRGNEYYSERMTSGSGHLVTFTTKKGDTQECSVTNECRNGLECLAGTGNQGKSYCLCAQGTAQKFWDSENNICRSVEDLKIQTEEVTTTATSVTLRWSLISTYGLSVKYYLDWSSGRREEVTSPKELHGLTPGQVYSYHLVPFLRGNEYYSERMTSGSGHLVTFTTKPAQPGRVNVTASQLTFNPMKVVFGKSDGVVDYYIITVTSASHGRSMNINTSTSEAQFNLENAHDYNYNISAYNSIGENSVPQTGSFRTNAQASSPVTNLKVESIRADSVTVIWWAPDDPNGNITAFVIRVLDGHTQDCLHGYNLMCSDCQGPRPSTPTECDSNKNESAFFRANEVVENSPKIFSYPITSLSPFQFYSVKIFAFNEIGDGQDLLLNFTTAEDRANNITHISVTSGREGTPLHVYLDVVLMPGAQTGLTNYNVTLTNVENGFVSIEYLNGFSNTSVRFSNVLAYHNYRVSAFAETDEGRSPGTIESAIVRSRVNKPGRAINLKIDPDTDIAVQFNLSFECPSQDSRNGSIEMARVMKTSLANSDTKDFNVTNQTECKWMLSSQQLGSFKVSQNFSFTVTLVNKDLETNPNIDLESDTADIVFFNATPKPPIFQAGNKLVKPPSEEILSETLVQLAVCGSCITDDRQGTITIAGLIVCVQSEQNRCDGADRSKRSTKTTDDYIDYTKWAQSQAGSFKIPYRATPRDWLLTNPSDTFTIGNDRNCAKGVAGNNHCNGPLPSGRDVVITVFSCTRGGCTESDPYYFRTKASDGSDDIGLIVGIVVGIIVLLVVTVLIIVFIIIRRRKPRDRGSCITLPTYDTKESRPIPIRKFKEMVEKFHKDANLLFQSEFEDIKDMSRKLNVSTHEALTEDNRGKNRYVDILPYDHSRVKLQVHHEEGDSTDYINANYIPGFNSVREYIATQGPIHSTIPHFWRMVWEQKSTVIVMLSDLTENNKLKVSLYWPENLNEPINYGEVLVEMTNFSQLNKYTIRNFRISFGEKSRRVTHFFIPGWSDFSANLTYDDVLEFAQLVRKEATPPKSGPVLVHCSAGVGRTGTFIALDYFLQYIERHGLDTDLDVCSFVMSMRKNRPRMVQAEAQYIFIFDALVQVIDKKLKAEAENLYENTKNEPVYNNQEALDEHIYANQAEDHTYSNQGFVGDYDNLPANPTTVL